MTEEEFNKTVNLVMQDLSAEAERDQVILPEPETAPDPLELKKLGSKLVPIFDKEYVGSLDVEETGKPSVEPAL